MRTKPHWYPELQFTPFELLRMSAHTSTMNLNSHSSHILLRHLILKKKSREAFHSTISADKRARNADLKSQRQEGTTLHSTDHPVRAKRCSRERRQLSFQISPSRK